MIVLSLLVNWLIIKVAHKAHKLSLEFTAAREEALRMAGG